jgi:DNA repair photolyase
MPQDIQIKSMLNKTKKRDSWFLDDYTINPYSGCSFNCLYCYIRGSKYGFNMEEKLSIKSNAIEILEKQLYSRAKKNQYGIIVLSSATDPYLQFEKEQELTKGILQVILKYKFPVHIITKSDLVIRDFDLLHQINKAAILPSDLLDKVPKKVFITFSFSTTENSVAKIFEPGATPPAHRLKAMKESVTEGFHTGVSLMPLLPFISDTAKNLERMFIEFQSIKINYLFGASLSLFGNNNTDSKTLVLKAIQKNYPHLLIKYEKYFGESNFMPQYYSKALNIKIKELCNKFEINNGLLNSF